jgi:hypothetical protein
MFNLFEYLEPIQPTVAGIEKIYRVSSLVKLEEVLSDLRSNPVCCLVVRDSGDGFLNLKNRRLDTAYHMFYLMVRATDINSSAARLLAKRQAMATAIKLLDRMKQDAGEFGDPLHGFNDNRIDYSEIGPIGRNYFGYSFSFLIEQGFN